MKPNSKMLFGNIFDDKNITPTYLSRFADDLLAKLMQNNVSNEYNEIIHDLEVKLAPLHSELGQVDTTLNTQVGKTMDVDAFIDDFKKYMKDKYVNIAAALGGEKTPAFIEFYPHGKTEYTTVTKTKIPTIMERLKLVASNYQSQLGDEISNQLQTFQTKWNDVRESQLQQKSAVKTNRNDRTQARRALEIELLKTIHFIGGKFPGDQAKCKVFFDFNLLFGVHHSNNTTPPTT